MRAAFFLLFVFFIGLMFNSSHGASHFLPEKFKAKFTQEYKSAVSGAIKRGTGQVDYQYPSKLRFEMFSPDPLTFVMNAKKNWYYRPPFIEGEEGELKKNVEGGKVFSTFFDSLKAGLKNNEHYQVKDNGAVVELIFSQKSLKDTDLEKAVLQFKNKSSKLFTKINEITLHYKNGKKTKIIFNELETIKSFPKNYFTFKVP